MSACYQLNVIDGDYGLVSFDVDCIQSILYARLSKVPVTVNVLNNLKSCTLYNPSSLTNGKLCIENFNNIVVYFKHLGYNIDHILNAKQCSEMLALTNFVAMKLKPVIDFFFWLDQRNCDELTNLWYMKALPFPNNYSYTKRKKNNAINMSESLFPSLEDNFEVIKDFLIKDATNCLSSLSTRLGQSDYFFGNAPTTLDVIVYAHIAPFLKIPFPTNDITSLLSLWPNLLHLIKRIDAKYLSDIPSDVKYLKSKEKIPAHSDEDVSYMAIFILAVSATSLILSFAVKRGFVKI